MSDRERRPSRALAALRWIAFAIAALVFVRVLASADLRRAGSLIARIGPAVVLIALPYLAIIGFDALAWRWVFAILGRHLAFHRLLVVRLGTEAVLLSFPGGAIVAETLKPWLLLRRDAVPVAETTATLAAKKVLLVSTQSLYLVLAALAGFAELAAISTAVVGRSGLPFLVLGTAAGLAVAALAMGATFLFGGLGARTHRLLARVPSRRLASFLAARRTGFLDADAHLASVFGAHVGKLALCAIPFFLSWLSETLESFVILRLLGARLGFVSVMGFEAVVSLLRSIFFFVPAGLGVQDVAYATALRALSGVHPVADPADVAAAFVLLKRAKELLWIAIGYALLAFVRGPVFAPPRERSE